MNARDEALNRGACEDHEFEITELVDGELEPARADALSAHLAACASCRVFHERLSAMDRALGGALVAGPLAADFDARLRERIDRIARGSSRDVALARAENDYRSTLRLLQREGRRRALLQGVGVAGLVAGLWLGLERWALEAMPGLAAGLPGAGTQALPLVGLCIAGAAIVAGTAASRLLEARLG